MLSKVADFYDQEVEAAMASLTSMIEPVLIAVMGAWVGGMVIALYMPLFTSLSESVLFAEQFLVVGQANPVERFEIGIPDVACFGERCHVAEPIPAGGGRPPAL